MRLRHAIALLACGQLLSRLSTAELLAPPRLAEAAQAEALSFVWDVESGLSMTLLTDAWWSNDSTVSHPRCSGVGLAACVVDSGLLPSAPVTVQLLAVEPATQTEVARSEAVTFHTAERGACGTLPDATLWRDNQAHLRGDVTQCLEACSISGGDCTEACVLKRTPLSPRCGACWSAYYDCAEEHCTVSCGFSPRSSKCHACTEAACTASGLACTGMPLWAWTMDSGASSSGDGYNTE